MEESSKIMISVISAVIGAFIGGFISIITTLLNTWNQRRVEKDKIYGSAKLEALAELMEFAIEMENNTFPLAENINQGFSDTMVRYHQRIRPKILYYSKEIQEILYKFDSIYVCLHRGELVPETREEVDTFLEKEAFEQAEQLKELAQKESRKLF